MTEEYDVENMTLAEYEQHQNRYEQVCKDCGSYFLTHTLQRTICRECSVRRYKAKKARAQQ